MNAPFYKAIAYEADGTKHTFEAFATRKKIQGFKAHDGAPYTILLDGSFLADAESGYRVGEEINDTIQWFGWSRTNPNYA